MLARNDTTTKTAGAKSWRMRVRLMGRVRSLGFCFCPSFSSLRWLCIGGGAEKEVLRSWCGRVRGASPWTHLRLREALDDSGRMGCWRGVESGLRGVESGLCLKNAVGGTIRRLAACFALLNRSRQTQRKCVQSFSPVFLSVDYD
jgi:hypothetical protein